MRVSSVSIKADGMPERIQLGDGSADPETNWLTVLTGVNGTRKSLLLRLLAGAALGRPTFKSPGHSTASTEISFAGGFPSKTVALSGTPNHRLPGVSGIPVTRTPTTFDVDEYLYFGPKYAGGVAARTRSVATLMHSLLRSQSRIEDRAFEVRAILAHLGYSGAVRLSMSPHPDLRKKSDQARAAEIRKMASALDDKLAANKVSYGSSFRGFVATLMERGPELDSALALVRRGHNITLDFSNPPSLGGAVAPASSVEDLANLLAAGLLVAEEVELK